MTTKERAEKIVREWENPDGTMGLVPLIAAELDAHAEEAVKQMLSDEIRTGAQLEAEISEEIRQAKFEEFVDGVERKAWNAAIEEAAKIADLRDKPTARGIRALKKTEEK